MELRRYQVTQGVWSYFTVKFPLEEDRDYITITTLDGARALLSHYGAEHVRLVYLRLDDRTRLLRCIERETLQTKPDYAEVCRRFLADQADFSEERLGQFPEIYPIDSGESIAYCMEQWRRIYQER